MMDTDPPLLKDSRLRWIAAAVLVLVVLVWLGTPNLLRSRSAANESKHALASFVAQAVESDHKILETGFMLMTVRNPSETSDKIRHIAEQMGGSVLNADISETGRDSMALLTISIPESEFEEARVQIRRVGLKVDSERLETKNATKEYVDESARLRNLHAQEMQYLTILKQAKTIKDTLEVSDKLNAVRAQIEQQQSEFNALSNQVNTVALTLSLQSESEAQVFGLNWRPLYDLKLAARDGLEAVGVYAGVMVSILAYLPAIILWLVTLSVGAAAGWKLFIWGRRVLSPQLTKAA